MDVLATPNAALNNYSASQDEISQAKRALKDAKNKADIEKAAQEFEAVFITEMLKPMFEGIKTDGPFGGGKGEEIFRGLLLQEYGQQIARNNGLGIAEHVQAELLRIQEQEHTGLTQ